MSTSCLMSHVRRALPFSSIGQARRLVPHSAHSQTSLPQSRGVRQTRLLAEASAFSTLSTKPFVQARPRCSPTPRLNRSASFLVMAAGSGSEVATLGGGCFWCLEACYQQLKGVYKVESGYAGGHVPNPTYEQICGKKTGHTEVVQVTYDPSVVSFKQILQVFFTIHDPTTPNRQGNDVGPQYRSAIYYHDDSQRQVAEEVIQEFVDEKMYNAPFVTELAPLNGNYYKAEGYHQNYFNDNPFQGYCMFVVAPKVQKFRAKWASQLMK